MFPVCAGDVPREMLCRAEDRHRTLRYSTLHRRSWHQLSRGLGGLGEETVCGVRQGLSRHSVRHRYAEVGKALGSLFLIARHFGSFEDTTKASQSKVDCLDR